MYIYIYIYIFIADVLFRLWFTFLQVTTVCTIYDVVFGCRWGVLYVDCQFGVDEKNINTTVLP
jgi:hypothetical protein